MNNFVKKEVLDIEISGIRQFNQIANSVDGVIKLTIGELDFDTPTVVKEKAIQAINENKTRYTTNKGIVELRKKIAKKHDYNYEEVILTVGTTEGLAIVLKSVIEENDEVLIPTPAYVGYKPLITLEKGIVKEVDTSKTNFMITLDSLEKSYTKKTKAMIVTSPNNPTGKVLSNQEMDIIKDFVLDKNILLISDEIYSDISFVENKSFSTYKELKNNLVVLNGFSKSHAMTGFRIGYVLSDINLSYEFTKVHQYNVTSTSTISQYAALEAMDTKNDEMVQTLQERRDNVLRTLDKLDIPYIKPEGAFYVFFDVSKYNMSSYIYCIELLRQEKVACIPGGYFLGHPDNYVRLSYAVDSKVLKEALKKLEQFDKNH